MSDAQLAAMQAQIQALKDRLATAESDRDRAWNALRTIQGTRAFATLTALGRWKEIAETIAHPPALEPPLALPDIPSSPPSKSGLPASPSAPQSPEDLACLLQPYVRRTDLFELWEAHGFHLLPAHFYSPVPLTSDLPDSLWERKSDLPGVDLNEAGQLRFIEEICPRYKPEYDAFPHEPTANPADYYLNQQMFRSGDAETLYAMVRHFKPSRMIEIGSGLSTRVSAAALLRNRAEGQVCHFTAIEPYPNDVIRNGFPGLDRLIDRQLQTVPIEEFLALRANDILFIDSSHTVKTGNDVLYEFLEILPRLSPGVVVHIHDIFLPNEYPREWVKVERRFWAEQYLLQAFLQFNSDFEILFAGQWMHVNHREKLEQTFGNYRRFNASPGSFWIRRKQ